MNGWMSRRHQEEEEEEEMQEEMQEEEEEEMQEEEEEKQEEDTKQQFCPTEHCSGLRSCKAAVKGESKTILESSPPSARGAKQLPGHQYAAAGKHLELLQQVRPWPLALFYGSRLLCCWQEPEESLKQLRVSLEI